MTKIKEYKRKCKECGKVWHSLASREEEIQDDIKTQGHIGVFTAFGNQAASAQALRNAQALHDSLDKLRKCPKCGSANYTETITTFEKK